jgi:WS/DGAT/MGAT family acyltransferase
MTICTGALRRYLLEKDELPDKPLVAMVPVSTRTKDEKTDMGNQVSAMLIQLPTDEEDPIEQLRRLHQNTKLGKQYQQAVGAKQLTDYAEFVPFGLGAQAARLYTRMNVSKYHAPIFNVVITNVPGPQVPLYMNGKKMLAHMGMAPIFDGMGLILPIFSYNGVLSISPTTAANIMPDVDLFARYLRESANTLENSVAEMEAIEKIEENQ